MSRTVLDERLSRALTAFLRQEVQAPATAVTDLFDMIVEDARAQRSPRACSPISTRMRGASVQLDADMGEEARPGFVGPTFGGATLKLSSPSAS